MITATETEQDRRSWIHRFTGTIVLTCAYFGTLLSIKIWLG